MTKKEYKQAYIWIKILDIYKPDDANVNEKTLSNFAQLHRLDYTFLDRVAESTLDKILQGKFKAPKY